jgi:hypothetical protein
MERVIFNRKPVSFYTRAYCGRHSRNLLHGVIWFTSRERLEVEISDFHSSEDVDVGLVGVPLKHWYLPTNPRGFTA